MCTVHSTVHEMNRMWAFWVALLWVNFTMETVTCALTVCGQWFTIFLKRVIVCSGQNIVVITMRQLWHRFHGIVDAQFVIWSVVFFPFTFEINYFVVVRSFSLMSSKLYPFPVRSLQAGSLIKALGQGAVSTKKRGGEWFEGSEFPTSFSTNTDLKMTTNIQYVQRFLLQIAKLIPNT